MKVAPAPSSWKHGAGKQIYKAQLKKIFTSKTFLRLILKIMHDLSIV